jgi:hypothetical protein
MTTLSYKDHILTHILLSFGVLIVIISPLIFIFNLHVKHITANILVLLRAFLQNLIIIYSFTDNF